ncbi:hypothetical protein SLE2022_307650 [Rubroshorea leprosula]
MPNLRNRFLVLLLFSSFVILTTSQHESIKSKQKHVAMFVFGDSVFDPGNNNFLNISVTQGKANFPPYGETFFHYPTGRFCDGRIIPDFTASFAGLPLWRPYLDPANHNLLVGANFASGGACVLVENNPYTLNLPIQLGFFKEVVNLLTQQLGESDTKKLLREAIYISSLGGVDYMTFASSSSNVTESEMQEYVNIVIGNMTKATMEIYKLGGRKFAFQSVGPLGCVPKTKAEFNSTGECVEFLQNLATMHNNALAKVAEELEIRLSGFKYLMFDFFTSLMDRANNPEKYGFKVGDNACCGGGAYHAQTACGWLTEEYELCSDPSKFVFWDALHPTEYCYSQLAQLLWNGTGNVTWPLNMKQLYDLDIDAEISSQDIDLISDA